LKSAASYSDGASSTAVSLAAATRLAAEGNMTSRQAAILDGAIYVHGQRLASLAPKSR
jgi:hypothetical protein